MHQKKMLPGNFPKFGSFLVDPTAKFSRIELQIGVQEGCFSVQGNVLALKEALIRGLGRIIPFDGLIANAFFGDQFEGGLKEIDIEP